MNKTFGGRLKSYICSEWYTLESQLSERNIEFEGFAELSCVVEPKYIVSTKRTH